MNSVNTGTFQQTSETVSNLYITTVEVHIYKMYHTNVENLFFIILKFYYHLYYGPDTLSNFLHEFLLKFMYLK